MDLKDNNIGMVGAMVTETGSVPRYNLLVVRADIPLVSSAGNSSNQKPIGPCCWP